MGMLPKDGKSHNARHTDQITGGVLVTDEMLNCLTEQFGVDRRSRQGDPPVRFLLHTN